MGTSEPVRARMFQEGYSQLWRGLCVRFPELLPVQFFLTGRAGCRVAVSQ